MFFNQPAASFFSALPIMALGLPGGLKCWLNRSASSNGQIVKFYKPLNAIPKFSHGYKTAFMPWSGLEIKKGFGQSK
jgi:hypothetical protein